MSKLTRFGLLLPMLLFVLATSTVRCTCDPSTNECLADAHCAGSYAWRSDDCTEQEGHWECIARTCISVCPECALAADCAGTTWDGPCAEIDGHWECQDGACLAVCDGAECLDAADCDGETWPGDAGCAAAAGHWECNAQICEAVCDGPECSQAADCTAMAWPGDAGCIEADGHWECTDGSCDAVCDPVGCSQVSECESNAWPGDMNCFAADGHWECNNQICEPVCDVDCSEAAHCQGNTWPSAGLDCEEADGFWTCEAGLCVGNCNGDECLAPVDCDAMAWSGQDGCGGYWSCEHGFCGAICDETGCGDDSCDSAGGETPVSCPADCAECVLTADCLGSTWELACAGRWSCEAGVCENICDYTNCGDGFCDAASGEDDESCRPDCGGACQMPSDCLGETWGEICQGSWTCNFMAGGVCQENCTAPLCGNGTCQPELGEGDRCPDCSGQLCSADSDCDALDLPAGCSGYWTCAWVVCLPICE